MVTNIKQTVKRYKLLSVTLIITTKQKPIVNKQKIKRKEYKHIIKQSHQTTKEQEEKKKGTERNYKHNQKTVNKMSESTYLK